MQTPTRILDTFTTFAGGVTPLRQLLPTHLPFFTHRRLSPRVFYDANPNPNPRRESRGERVKVEVKGKDNVWSVDNEVAKQKERENLRKKRRKGKRVQKVVDDSNVIVSGSMLMELETVLQTQEPVIRPSWNTFVSSLSGIWKGVGAVFSPITAEMEPVDMGGNNEYLYDCYTLSCMKAVDSGGNPSQIQRKINWVTLNPYGEEEQDYGGNISGKHIGKGKGTGGKADHVIPKFESFDFAQSDVMEEDFMGLEPGLVFFEDGSYSRGPVEVPVGEDNSNYYLSPTYKFEQCLVKGCHKRLRIVHTIEFSNGGADIQILRVAVYEEQWVGPANIDEHSEVELDMKPFSQRKRTRPSELTGQWKVFEMSATPIFGDEKDLERSNGPPYVYLCMETVKNRSLPENPAYFGEEEMVDMHDVAVLWLPGGVTAYVDVNKDGILCIGVGWYSDEGINLVMERDYETDGKLREVRSKTEVKRRLSDPLPL